MLGAFALTEVLAAKVVVALGDTGRARVAEIEAVHERMAGVVQGGAR
jgi:hypothetical protein